MTEAYETNKKQLIRSHEGIKKLARSKGLTLRDKVAGTFGFTEGGPIWSVEVGKGGFIGLVVKPVAYFYPTENWHPSTKDATLSINPEFKDEVQDFAKEVQNKYVRGLKLKFFENQEEWEERERQGWKNPSYWEPHGLIYYLFHWDEL